MLNDDPIENKNLIFLKSRRAYCFDVKNLVGGNKTH